MSELGLSDRPSILLPAAGRALQSGLAKVCVIEIGRSLEWRQHWKLITLPTTTSGTKATSAITGDSGLGVITSSAISEIIQSVAKITAKSILGIRSQYRMAEVAVAGAIA